MEIELVLSGSCTWRFTARTRLHYTKEKATRPALTSLLWVWHARRTAPPVDLCGVGDRRQHTTLAKAPSVATPQTHAKKMTSHSGTTTPVVSSLVL